jgi:hypothetical protein
VNGGGELCARPVKPFGRGRPWLRWTRALCKFNRGEGAALSRAETVLQGTTPDTVRAEIGYGAKTVVEEGGRRDRFDGEAQRCERLEVPRVFELERVVSCRRADPWWRTKLDFGSGESLDDLHRCTALRAAPRIGEVFGAGAVLFGLWLLCRTQQLKAKR